MIIDRELSSSINHKITKCRFIELTDSILELFPNQKRDLYYIPAKKGKNNTKVNARGSLYNTYNEVRRSLAHAKILKDLEDEVPSEESTELDNDDIQWLKENHEPPEKILSKWSKTYEHRMKWNTEMIGEYFDSFPCLKGPEGYKLLMIDFDELYKSQSDLLINKWSGVTKKILALAKKNRSSLVQTCSERYTDEFINTDREALLGFLMLPLLLTKPAFKALKSNECFDPKKEFIQKSFIFYAETNDEIRDFIAEKTKFYAKHNLPHQPYVIVYESGDELISSIRINEVIYNVKSPVLAMDCCFKTFYSLNAQFPKESEHVWKFIAHSIYELKDDNLPKLVLNFIEELDTIK